MALDWKEIPYQLHAVNLLKGEHANTEYLAVNPAGMVPALAIDGVVLTNSLAIIEYLEETRPEKPLLPRDASERARVRALTQIVASDTQPIQNLSVLMHVNNEYNGDRAAWARHFLERGFRMVEKSIDEAQEYLVGDSLTVADLSLVSMVPNARRFGVDFTDLPRVSSVIRHVEMMDELQDAAPFRQPDCPEELKL